MKRWPTLKTGQWAQYPMTDSTAYATQIVRFMDGSEQRSPRRGTAGRSWRLQYTQLEEGEASLLLEFVRQNDNFIFPDPTSGKDVPGCVVPQEDITLELGDDGVRLELVVRGG